MLEHLDRRGEGSKYRFHDEQGDLIKASRRRGQLHLDVIRTGEKDTHVALPWAIAQCMLGQRVELPEDARAETVAEDGAALSVSIE